MNLSHSARVICLLSLAFFTESSILVSTSTGISLKESSINSVELDYCVNILEQVAVGGYVGKTEFLLFLEKFDGQALAFDEFGQLPSQLVLMFYTAACTGGRDCTSEEPIISVSHLGASEAFLLVFCSSVKDIAVEQLILDLQYQVKMTIQPRNCMTEGEKDERFRDGFQRSVARVILNGLQCGVANHVGSNQSPLQLPVSPDFCDYSVVVHVYDVRDIPCFVTSPVQRSRPERAYSPSNDELITCLLITSQVKVTEVALFLDLTRQDLRAYVISSLKAAIESGRFDEYLEESQRIEI